MTSDPIRKARSRLTRRWIVLAMVPVLAGTVAVSLPVSGATPAAAAREATAEGAPWDGTSISPGLGPTYGEEWCAPTEGEYVDDWQEPPLALMPYAAVGCTLDKIRQEAVAAGVPRRLSVQEIGSSTVNDRPIYGVVVDARETREQRVASDHWHRIRTLALTDPARAQKLVRQWRDTTKVPIYVQGNIHGDEVEGTDAIMQIIRDLATTPRGTHPDVDLVLDNVILVFVPTINPDGRVAGTRRNGNNFDMNRDFFTQSQDEVKASVSMMRDWLPVSMLDLHGYYDPTEVDGQTKPHNPGIEYDLYQPWNIDRVNAVTEAMGAAGYDTQVPVFDWCPDAELVDPCADGTSPDPKTAQGFDDWGPFYTPTYAQLSGAMDSSTIEMCWESCGESLGSKTVQYVSVWASMRYVAEHAESMLTDQLEVYERGVEGAPRAECCPEPFGPVHNWMSPYPKAYVIPFDGAQRSNAEANRLVDWLLFQELEVTRSKRKVTWHGQTFPKSSYVVWMDQAKRGLVDTTLSIGEDISDRVDTLYAPPAAWSHGALWGATTVQIPADARFSPPTEPVRRVNQLETGPGPSGARSDFYSIAVDSPAAVRAVNALVDRGVPAQLALEPFQSTSGGPMPAGTVIFPVPNTNRPAYRALVQEGREAGVTFDRNRGDHPTVEPIDGVPRIAVLASVQDQAAWALQGLGFDAAAVPTGSSSALNDPNAPNPLADFDLVYNAASWPSGATARQRLIGFFQGGGGYVGAGPNGTAFIGNDGAGQLSGLTVESVSNGGQSGILRWEQVGGVESLLTGAYPTEDTAIADPIAWFSAVPAAASVDARLAGDDAFEAGLWRPADRTAPPDAPLVVHGESTASGSLARIAAFALDPLYRADPEREWPMLAAAAYWLDQ